MQNTVKKNLLKYCVEDIMEDYQRLTPSEAFKFDNKYGQIINKASQTVYLAFSNEKTVEDDILV